MDLAKVAYEAYRAHTGGISLASGQPIPEWDKLPAVIQSAWGAAAEALIHEHPDTGRIDWLERTWKVDDECPIICIDSAFIPGTSGTYAPDMRLRDAIDTAKARARCEECGDLIDLPDERYEDRDLCSVCAQELVASELDDGDDA